jgi:iron(II)-dependent oxidoreductase
MKRTILLAVICAVCAVIPLAAQTAEPENMVLVPAGKFWIGRAYTIFLDSKDLLARDRMDDRPANNIYLDAFYIDKYEVTNADYLKFIQATNAKKPWHWPQGNIPTGQERHAVYNVNWFEANDYCKWAGKRLPTEAEWEKAARGGLDRAHYPWGDDDVDRREQMLLAPQGAGRTSSEPVPGALGRSDAMAVGSFKPNGYGIYDVMGNVMEWTADWYDNNYYPFMPKVNPKGPETGRYKSVRGSGWADGGGHGENNTNEYRNFSDPELRMSTIGFRCAK